MSVFRQIAAVTGMNLRSVPRRLGTSSVVVIGIAGVVGVVVSVLGMTRSLSHTLVDTGRPDRAVVLRSDPAGYAACCAAVADVDWLERLCQVACPALVIAGALDVGAPVAMAQAIAERIAGSELLVLDETAHLSVVEQPAKFAAALGAFVGRLPG